ncbi:MAG: DUF1573 domain-containing protein [Muribaculaceae bacterium]|nr:DUF1573 domain-containing protein [Muribaculaceae bacterium]
MKKITLFLLFTLTVAASMSASGSIRWLATEHDFGAFDENDGKVSCMFRFVNTGDEDVAIVNVRATCGCTTSSYSRGAITPGDTATVTVVFNPVGRAGKFEKNVYVDCTTEPRRTELTIKGVVVGSSNTVRSRFPVDAGPLKLRSSMLAFGEIESNRMKTVYLDAYNTSVDTLRPKWENLPPYITVGDKPEGIAPGEFSTFAVTFDPFKCKEYGVITDEITLMAGKERSIIKTVAIVSEDFSRLTPAQLAKAPVIKVSPSRLELTPVSRAQGTVKCNILVSNDGKQPLLLRRVYSGDSGVDVESFPEKIKKGGSAVITVTINLEEIASDTINARVSIVSNSPSSPTTIVRIAGDILP